MEAVERCNRFLWSVPVLWMILGTGIWLTAGSRGMQLRLFPAALRAFLRNLRGGADGASSMQALCIALAATVGTGNIAGVACAISLGGPGAVFWMWVSGFLGMAIKLCESTLAVQYRFRSETGEILAGPMYIIRRGLPAGWRFLAGLYAFFGLFAAFGIGNATQVGAISDALEACAAGYGMETTPALRWAVGGLLAAGIYAAVSGGIRKIGAGASFLVPAASAAYAAVCVAAIAVHARALPGAMKAIVQGVWTPQAVTGGAVGSAAAVLRVGISRGVFTNEAGMGTAAMAHGSAEGIRPAEQGLMGIMEVFLDTIVICTVTAFVILTADVPIPYGSAAGAELTAAALTAAFGPWAGAFLCGCLVLFAAATILGWGLYAGRCAEYLLGKMNWRLFALAQSGCVAAGMLLQTGTVWILADLMNGLMAIPNLIALLWLSPECFALIRQLGTQSFSGKTEADVL